MIFMEQLRSLFRSLHHLFDVCILARHIALSLVIVTSVSHISRERCYNLIRYTCIYCVTALSSRIEFSCSTTTKSVRGVR